LQSDDGRRDLLRREYSALLRVPREKADERGDCHHASAAAARGGSSDLAASPDEDCLGFNFAPERIVRKAALASLRRPGLNSSGMKL